MSQIRLTATRRPLEVEQILPLTSSGAYWRRHMATPTWYDIRKPQPAKEILLLLMILHFSLYSRFHW